METQTPAETAKTKPSGQANRKQRRAVTEAIRRADKQRPYVDEYDRLGPPPLNDPLGALQYATDALLITLRQVSTDAHIDSETRWKLVADISAKLGMTHAKTVMQRRVKELSDKIKPEAKDAEEMSDTDEMERPPTARKF